MSLRCPYRPRPTWRKNQKPRPRFLRDPAFCAKLLQTKIEKNAQDIAGVVICGTLGGGVPGRSPSNLRPPASTPPPKSLNKGANEHAPKVADSMKFIKAAPGFRRLRGPQYPEHFFNFCLQKFCAKTWVSQKPGSRFLVLTPCRPRPIWASEGHAVSK